VLAGCDPLTGESLRSSSSPVRVAGFDLTFSAPKSVSVVFGIADERVRATVRTAHDRAVREAVAYLERSAAAVRRGHGGVRLEQADGLIAAALRHRTSRAGDPQLHTHVVVANLGRGPDGRWSALDGRQLYAHAGLRASCTRRCSARSSRASSGSNGGPRSVESPSWPAFRNACEWSSAAGGKRSRRPSSGGGIWGARGGGGGAGDASRETP
jgi:hypothetical protein